MLLERLQELLEWLMINLREAASLGDRVKGQAALGASTQHAECSSSQLGTGSSPSSQLCFKKKHEDLP